MNRPSQIDDDTLFFPTEITKRIGLSVNEINALKSKGCPFYGRKTTVNLVRKFIHRAMGSEFLLRYAAKSPKLPKP